MFIKKYIKEVSTRYSRGISTEHSYRSDLQNLLKELVDGITVTNEPKRQKCGAPDYIIERKEVPIGYIEAKDIGIDLNKIEKTDQLKRYFSSLDNLILTDYIEFRFYQYGKKVKEIKIATIEDENIIPIQNNFDSFVLHLSNFCSFKGPTIKSAEKLAKMMAQKSRLMEEVLFNAIKEEDEDNTLRDQLNAFRKILIHDLDEKTFSDIYSQTIAYGLFAARLNDTTLEDFSRQEARDRIPKSNPFLRNLFDYVLGAQLDDRVVWIVNDLADIFRATDLQSILADFGQSTEQNDPFLHFYETFLAAYDPKLKKSKGVYYTPEPVVNFIIRAVDDILKEEFSLPQGLADTTRIKIKYDSGKQDKRSKSGYKKIDKEIHKVQILDPATGTGTFLTEIIKQIFNKFKGQEGLWSNYVENNLIPRLNGFEILMAPYTICHLKIEMLLKETEYVPKETTDKRRFKVYLTNSLEEAHPDSGTLFATWLSREATAANYVKEKTPIMIIVGNPPYKGESKNKGQWIMKLMEDYKKEPGGIEKLKERNPKWINDDYMKFIRYGQHFIEKNGSGILAFINPHGFLDNPTFRGVRWNLLKTYDKIYTIDLHGNTKKKECCPDGSPDVNVFDIKEQGVSINIFIKTGNKKDNELGKVFHYDVYGKRNLKYEFLWKNSLKSIKFNKLSNVSPMYYMIPKNYDLDKEYNTFIPLKELFNKNSMGVTTGKDSKFVAFNSDDFEFEDANKLVKKYSYRPFDNQYIYYNPKMLARSRERFMKHFTENQNVSMSLIRRERSKIIATPYITTGITDKCIISSLDNANIFPLYLYQNSEGEYKNAIQNRISNLNDKIIDSFSKKLGLVFSNEKTDNKDTFCPIDVFDYIYALLHSPNYREKYKEYLKIDFPRVPYPENIKKFWKLVKLGGELRQIHLMESTKIEKLITSYPKDGNNVVEVISYENEKVRINQTQYFGKVPQIAWEFYIGGYQPAQKWLTDRRGEELSIDNIIHYQKIIVALMKTISVQKEIDKIIKF